MSNTLTIRAFFFNAKTDYLPYYKNFTITVDADAKAKDLLLQIQEANENFSFPKQKLLMKINGLVVEGKESVAKLIEKLGTELQIDPVNTYRANDGLKINDDDFMQSYALLEPYATEADLKHYKTLYALHYASETENFDRTYIGDAILVLAHKMIADGNENKEAILTAITSPHSGLLDCEYENNLFNAQDHTTAIDELKAMVKNDDNTHPSLLDMIKERFFKKDSTPQTESNTEKVSVEIETLEEKHIAYYKGDTHHTEILPLIEKLNISTVHFSRAEKLSGLTLLNDNKTLAFTKAGTTLLDAFDAGAEVVVINDTATYDMIQNNFSAIESVLGRRMIGLELITAEDFVHQLKK